MLRGISFFGFAGLFLIISPAFRGSVTGGIESFTHQMELYAPWSYVAGVIAILMLLIFSFYRGAQPR
jgi:hypothetical protein